jgi:hypothetical protein
MKNNKLIVCLTAAIITLHACKKDADLPKLPEPINEPEVITSLTLTFTDSANASNVITANFIDNDGDGGNQPSTFDTIKLKPNITYFTSLSIFNSIVNEEITAEIVEEANDHLFIYKPTGLDLAITVTDSDSNTPALPIGLKSKWRAGNVGNGAVQIILKHQPGIKDGTEAPGDTDVDLNFQTKITN